MFFSIQEEKSHVRCEQSDTLCDQRVAAVVQTSSSSISRLKLMSTTRCGFFFSQTTHAAHTSNRRPFSAGNHLTTQPTHGASVYVARQNQSECGRSYLSHAKRYCHGAIPWLRHICLWMTSQVTASTRDVRLGLANDAGETITIAGKLGRCTRLWGLHIIARILFSNKEKNVAVS